MSRSARLFVLVALAGFAVWWSTRQHLSLIHEPAPAFVLPTLDDPAHTVSRDDLLGKPYLINVFASWCDFCSEEQPLLMTYGPSLGITMIGYDYKDASADARAWLAKYGNPYHLVITDPTGHTATTGFGVYGVPETFLVDSKGVIRYKWNGRLTPKAIQQELKPAIAALTKGNP